VAKEGKKNVKIYRL